MDGMTNSGSPPLGPPDPRRYREALDRWDRVLLAREGTRLLASACRKREVRRALGGDARRGSPGAQAAPAPAENPPLRVLELGCRTGRLARLIARRTPVAWTGVDGDEDRLALASARASGPTWLRHDPRIPPPSLPGAPFDLVIIHPWVVNGVAPHELEAFLRRTARLLTPRRGEIPGEAGSSDGSGPAPQGSLLLTLYRPVQLVHRWAHQTGGSDRGSWAWAWEGAYDAGSTRLDLHLLAFLPTSTPGRFTRLDEVVELYVHPLDGLRQAAEKVGFTGAERPVARDGHQALYLLTPVEATDPSEPGGSHQASHHVSPA